MIIILIGLLLVSSGQCAIIHVPTELPTVKRALNEASEHDTILVADGIYYENLIFPSINLTLASNYIMDLDSSHINQTILDGSQPSDSNHSSVLYMEGLQDSTTVIVGFTMQNGRGTFNPDWIPTPQVRVGGGIAIRNASPIVKFNLIQFNQAWGGGGIYMGGSGDAVIINNNISNNHASYWGGGIFADSCSLKIMGNHIHDNFSDYMAGGINAIYNDDAIISENYLDHNSSLFYGAGQFAIGNYLFIANTVADHVMTIPPAFGGGCSFGAGDPTTNVILTNNQFLRNHAENSFGALRLLSGVNGLISGNLFQDNSCVWAAGLNLWDGTYTISDNQFINNSGSSGGTIYIGTGATVEMRANTITGSTGSPEFASAIFTYANIPVEIHDNNIYGNSAPAVMPSTLLPQYTINADSNWWGDPSGPYHPILNPQGRGDTVGNGVLFDPWLTYYVGIPNQAAYHPTEFHLYPPRPNPFNATTNISYELRAASLVSLKVYDSAGRLVATLVEGWREAGTHEVTFDGSKLSSGLYFARMQATEGPFGAGEFSEVQKIMLVK